MSSKLIVICLVSLCLWCVISSANAETWHRVKVITVTHWVYDNVTVETIPNEPFIVVVNPNGATIRISRSSVSVILDEKGKDITAVVLESPPGAELDSDDTSSVSTSTPRSETSTEMPAVSPLRDYRTMCQPQPYLTYGVRYRFAILGGSGYSFATGHWFDGMTNGLSFNACGRLTLAKDVYVGLSYRYQKLGVDSKMKGPYVLYDDYGNVIGIVALDFDVHLTETYFLVGLMTEPYTYRSPFAFLEFGLGGVGHHIKATATNGREIASASYDETKFGVLFTVGVVFPFNQTVGLSLEGNMRLTGQGGSGSYDYAYQGTSGALFGVGTNLVIMLGK